MPDCAIANHQIVGDWIGPLNYIQWAKRHNMRLNASPSDRLLIAEL